MCTCGTVIFKGKWRFRGLKSSKFSGLAGRRLKAGAAEAPQGRRGQDFTVPHKTALLYGEPPLTPHGRTYGPLPLPTACGTQQIKIVILQGSLISCVKARPPSLASMDCSSLRRLLHAGCMVAVGGAACQRSPPHAPPDDLEVCTP